MDNIFDNVPDASKDAAPGTAPDDTVERMADAIVREYDMAAQERMVRRPMPTLDIVNERMQRYLRAGIFQFARRSPEITIEPTVVQRFSEFLEVLPAPVHFSVVALRPLRGSGLVVCESTLISALVDALYGGAGTLQSPFEGREFSPTEQRVIQRLLNLVCTEYAKAWKGVYPLELEFQRSETHPRFVNVAAPADLVLVTTLQITFGELKGAIRICKPWAVLDPVRDILYGAQQADAIAEDRRWVTQLTREIQSAEVTLTAELAQPELTVGQLLAMKPGDFIPLDRASRIVAVVDGTPVFACHYGTHNARYALRIDECVRSDSAHWLGGSHVH